MVLCFLDICFIFLDMFSIYRLNRSMVIIPNSSDCRVSISGFGSGARFLSVVKTGTEH